MSKLEFCQRCQEDTQHDYKAVDYEHMNRQVTYLVICPKCLNTRTCIYHDVNLGPNI